MSTFNWGNRSILLIDADWLNFELHKLHFKTFNCVLLFARSFEEASRMFYEHEIDLVITEVFFLDEMGKEFLQTVSDAYNIPVILQTTQVLDTLQLNNLGFTPDLYCQKPVVWEPYSKALNQYLSTDEEIRQKPKKQGQTHRNYSYISEF